MEQLQQLLAIDVNYILIVLMVIFYSLEQIIHTQFRFTQRPRHLLNNMLFFIVFYLFNFLWASVIVYAIEWLNQRQIGLFFFLQLPVWVKLVLAVMIFDFVSYWFHRLAHRVPVLWRFHRVHHSDTSMDASTYFRGHPVEIFLWFGTSNILAAAIFGLDLTALGLYFLVSAPFFIMEHANVRFPVWLDKSLGLIFTTPNMHKVHHEQDQFYTDANYADIFILWDRLFGTFKYKPTAEINFGLKEFEGAEKQSFWYLMKSPFIRMGRIRSDEIAKHS
jgi:sterol desaturase/sphingolipid hydroxylase (fatty acid hydroxylase superfamily)